MNIQTTDRQKPNTVSPSLSDPEIVSAILAMQPGEKIGYSFGSKRGDLGGVFWALYGLGAVLLAQKPVGKASAHFQRPFEYLAIRTRKPLPVIDCERAMLRRGVMER